MSDYERNKGKLIPQFIDTEHFSDDTFEEYEENGFVVIDREIYKVEWELKRFQDYVEFADVQVNENTGVITFHTLHYNGGAHWTEVIEGALK
ncbi:hypothetical protein D3C85_1050510 [compost metagenome]